MRRTVDEGPQKLGLSWSWGLDFDALLAALSEPAPWNRPAPRASVPAQAPAPARATAPSADPAVDPAGADFAELLEVIDQGRVREVPLTEVAGLIAESLPTGPDLAGWLATSSPGGLEDGALAGMATAYRRLASWAQAGELAVVAELASRSAAADDQIGVGEDGRPARLPDEACAQVSLALTMSHASASWWSDLAVTLRWRLVATGAALSAGQIDLGRARLIADATAALDDQTARAVEAKILTGAGARRRPSCARPCAVRSSPPTLRARNGGARKPNGAPRSACTPTRTGPRRWLDTACRASARLRRWRELPRSPGR